MLTCAEDGWPGARSAAPPPVPCPFPVIPVQKEPIAHVVFWR